MLDGSVLGGSSDDPASFCMRMGLGWSPCCIHLYYSHYIYILVSAFGSRAQLCTTDSAFGSRAPARC